MLLFVLMLISCSDSYEAPKTVEFVSNIPEVFWGNWVVDNDEFVNTMHFDIEKEHIWEWVENFEYDPHDVTNTGTDEQYVTEKSFDPSIYKPTFGDIGYEQEFFLYNSKYKRSTSSSLMLHYDSATDRIKLWMWHSNSGKQTEYTYYLERAPKSNT